MRATAGATEPAARAAGSRQPRGSRAQAKRRPGATLEILSDRRQSGVANSVCHHCSLVKQASFKAPSGTDLQARSGCTSQACRSSAERAVDCPIHRRLVAGNPVNYGEAFLAIPAIGYIRYANTITGRGRWDARNMILFRCVVQRPDCGKAACNRRMWFLLDNHPTHKCDACGREAQRRSASSRARANLGAYMPNPASLPPATSASSSAPSLAAIENPEGRPLAISDDIPHDLQEIGLPNARW